MINRPRVYIHTDKIIPDNKSLTRNTAHISEMIENNRLGWYMYYNRVFELHCIAIDRKLAEIGLDDTYLKENEFDFIEDIPMVGRKVRILHINKEWSHGRIKVGDIGVIDRHFDMNTKVYVHEWNIKSEDGYNVVVLDTEEFEVIE